MVLRPYLLHKFLVKERREGNCLGGGVWLLVDHEGLVPGVVWPRDDHLLRSEEWPGTGTTLSKYRNSEIWASVRIIDCYIKSSLQ